MKHGSLFSGIGGFDLAAEWMGWENMFHCEWNPFGQKILKYYWPKAKSYEDITKTDFTIWRGRIDILTGGFPCQPYSAAGKRKGKEDERHLWPEMLRAIREIKPKWIVGENVLGLVDWSDGLVFEEVQTDLEAQGYEVQPFVLPAAGVNAPHQRYRVWFVAFNTNSDADRPSEYLVKTFGRRIPFDVKKGILRRKNHICNRLISLLRKKESFTYTNHKRLQRWKKYGITKEGRSIRNEFTSGLLPSDWEKFPTQSPIYTGNDGIPPGLDGISISKLRSETVKASGNAIVPQVAHQIFKSINQFNNL